MIELNFRNENYKKAAMELKPNLDMVHNSVDSFYVMINGVSADTLSNLCDLIYENSYLFFGDRVVTKDDCYAITQNLNLSYEFKKMVCDFAQQIILDGSHLGNEMSGIHNTSAWISHSYYVGECCAVLATMLGVDVDKARAYGYLHDVGRKFDHKLKHVILGFEYLINIGWYNEAFGCLSHSFLKGGRCSNNEIAIPGYSVDKNGNVVWDANVEYDDITDVLNNYEYNVYDAIINIADLMATDTGIVSPYERIMEIASRRNPHPDTSCNRRPFLCDFINTLIDVLKAIKYIGDDVEFQILL